MDQTLADLDELIAEREEGLSAATDFGEQVRALEEALDSHYYWSRFFKLLEGRVRPKVIFENFNADADNRLFSASVLAPTYEAAAEQIVYMEQDELVERVMTSSVASRFGPEGGLAGVSFIMTVKMDPAAWARIQDEAPAVAATEEQLN